MPTTGSLPRDNNFLAVLGAESSTNAKKAVALQANETTGRLLIDTTTDIALTEDAAHSTGDTGVMAMAVRKDSAGTLVDTDGDYSALQVDDAGSLRVTGGGGGTEYNEDAATPATIVGTATLMERDDALATVTPIEGDWIGLRGTAEGALWVQDYNSDAILADTTAIKTAVEIIDNAIDGTEMQVDVITMPTVAVTGTFWQATQPISVASLPLPSGAATSANQQTDALTDAELRAAAVPVSLASVPSHAVTNAGTFAVQVDGAALTALQLIDNIVQAEDAVHGTSDSGVMALAVRNDTLGALAGTDGDYAPFQVNASGALYIQEGAALDVSAATVTVSGTVTANLGATDNAVLDTIDAVLDAIKVDTEAIETALETAGGLVVNLGANNDVTVTGTVTVDLGANNDVTTELTTDDLDTGVGTDTRAVVGMVLAESGGGVLVGSANPLPVDGSGVTQPVSGTVTANLGATDNAVLDQIEVNTSYGDNTGGGTETGTLRVTIANDSTGVLSIDDNGGALTVDGTVTANLSATDNAVLDTIDAVLDAINAKLVTGTVIGDVNLGATDNAVLDDIAAKLATIDTDTSALAAAVSTEYQVDVVGSLPAGTNAIGKLAANTGVDIGDVDVTSITGLTMSNAAAQVTGDEAHDAPDAGNPIKVGYKAVDIGSNPTEVAANDRTDGYANRAGVPFVQPGHPNVLNASINITDADGAQTDTALVTVGAGEAIVVTLLQVYLDEATTAGTQARIGFGATNTPANDAAKVIMNRSGIPPGGGAGAGTGSGIVGQGAANEDLRITSADPAGGNMDVIVTYYTIAA